MWYTIVLAFVLCIASNQVPTGGTITVSALSHKPWLVKTKETFKLADLQLLGGKLQTQSFADCRRLVLDAATGSSLLQLNPHFNTTTSLLTEVKASLFLKQYHWLGRVLASGSSGENLVAQLRGDSFERDSAPQNCPWTLNYLRMILSGDKKKLAYTQKTLLCAIAQQLQEPAALNPNQALDRLLLVESGKCIYLVKLLDTVDNEKSLVNDKWSQRPFPYSSAMNLEAATIVMDTLAHLVDQRQQLHAKLPPVSQPPCFLDVACGSGTFLALALERGMKVVGWDSNPACTTGSRENLEFLFGKSRVEHDCQIESRDSLLELSSPTKKLNVDWARKL